MALRQWLASREMAILKIVGIVVPLVIWQVWVDLLDPNSPMVSSPTRIFKAAREYVGSHQFFVDVTSSGVEFFWGFALAIVVGIGLGYVLGWFRRLEYVFDPFINFLYASPRIALAPLLILWLGIGIGSKIAIIFLMSVFPILINTMLGVRSADRDLIELARSFNASNLQLLRTIVVPSSMPFIVTGVRIGLGVALIGVVVGEFIAATRGVGFTIQQAAANFNVDLVFVGLILIGFAGLLFTELLHQLEEKLTSWTRIQ
jgi:ABC-type nitrate/sulfonate/bicarbonate transport system permease component